MSDELAKVYNPRDVEDRIYKFWLDGKYFEAEADGEKTPYTIVMPPPNITGQLHMGHALDNTLPDILIRYRRMQGYAALWVPGTDHASIATEAKIVESLRSEGLTKEQVGREEFLRRAEEWRRQYGGRIIEQLKKLGCSCDWRRERFTLDEGCSKAVREVFVRLYEKGLIYRGNRIINWCPRCRTTISDAEVEYNEHDGMFWHLRYPYTDGSGYIELATTRPETLLGDTAVAVHPNDPRYADAVGKTVRLPLVGREIPVVADEYVDPEFGTGAVKITPAHDPNDFEVGLRHNLPVINVMTDDAKITADYPRYAGMDRYEARKLIVEDLKKEGALVKTEPMRHNVGECYRCHTVVEPRVSTQWFVKMKPLAEPAVKAVENGEIKMIPERFEKTFYNWMRNIKDWCISRQLWWGHRIPAWYCDDCGETIVSREDPEKCPKCGGVHLRRDEDTLDTWFSSALWPFSVFGWPDKNKDYDYFYPTSTLITGYDIIFFWVSRMIFSALEYTGKVPFRTVLYHGLVRDAKGRKMSKSMGNGVDPLKEIEKYGADALRFTLATGNTPGNDLRYSPERVEASRNFANKIWNAARFVRMNITGDEDPSRPPKTLATPDKWILSKLNRLTAGVTENLDKFEIGLAVSKLYDFIWDVFCDWYIEIAKVRLNGSGEENSCARRMLVFVLNRIVKLLHPFMPFITEEIYLALPHECESVMISNWPVADESLNFPDAESRFEKVMAVIRGVRNRRSELKVPSSRKTRLYISAAEPEVFLESAVYIKKLAYVSDVLVTEPFETQGTVRVVTADAAVYIPLRELVDVEAETARLRKELESAKKDEIFYETKLNNPNFVAKAPENVVEAQRESLAKVREKIARLGENLSALQNG